MRLFLSLILVFFLSACKSTNELDELKGSSKVSPTYSTNSSFNELKSNIHKYVNQCFGSLNSNVKMNGTSLGSQSILIDELQREDGVDFVVKQFLDGGAHVESGYYQVLLFSLKNSNENNTKPSVTVYSMVPFYTESIFEKVEQITQGKTVDCYV